MKNGLFILTIIIVCLISCTKAQSNASNQKRQIDSILKIEMELSSFGVEAEDFPNIDAKIDFTNDTGICIKSFYNPAYKASIYSLTKNEINSIRQLLKIDDLQKLKNEYTVSTTDQPSSKTIIYTTKRKFVINDYGLGGGYLLKQLYKIVYKY